MRSAAAPPPVCWTAAARPEPAPKSWRRLARLNSGACACRPVSWAPTLRRDIPLPANVRRYYFPGVTHGGGRGGFQTIEPGTAGRGCALPDNPNSTAESMRALRRALMDWVVNNTAPPESRYPTIARGELAAAGAKRDELPGDSRRSAPGQPDQRVCRITISAPGSATTIFRERFRFSRPWCEATSRCWFPKRTPMATRLAVSLRSAPGAARIVSGLERNRVRLFQRARVRVLRRLHPVRENGSAAARVGRSTSFPGRTIRDARKVRRRRCGTRRNGWCGNGFLLQEDADRMVREAEASAVLR